MRSCSVCVCVYYHSDRDPVYPRSQCDHKVTYNPPLAVILYTVLSLSLYLRTHIFAHAYDRSMTKYMTDKTATSSIVVPLLCCVIRIRFFPSISARKVSPIFLFLSSSSSTDDDKHTQTRCLALCVCVHRLNRSRLNTHIYRLFLCALYIYMCV